MILSHDKAIFGIYKTLRKKVVADKLWSEKGIFNKGVYSEYWDQKKIFWLFVEQ